jgi:osmotically-inducible protein OsmY
MRTSLTVIAIAALALAACQKQDDGKTVGQKVDEAIAQTKTAAEEAKQNAQKGLDTAAQKTKEASQDLSKKADDLSKKTEDLSKKTGALGQKVSDATITASVKAGIAKDPDLSALKIDVDTSDGKVSLNGTAPSEAAKQRASSIAQGEKGVTGVENKLVVASR